LAAVAHTNFMETKHFGDHHLTYFGNYLPQNHPYLSMTKEQLLKLFLPYIKRLAGKNTFKIIDSFTFTGFFAQPVHQKHYSSKAPKLITPLPFVYLANMDSIYPWDRGTNYAVELGIRASNTILKS
jgi:protoporphyrinogen oxidase